MNQLLEIEGRQSRSIKTIWGILWRYWVQHVLSRYLHNNGQSQDAISLDISPKYCGPLVHSKKTSKIKFGEFISTEQY